MFRRERLSSQIKPTTAAATAKGSSPFPPPSLWGPNNLYVRNVVAVMCIWREGASLIRGQAPGNIPPYNIGARTYTHSDVGKEREIESKCRSRAGGEEIQCERKRELCMGVNERWIYTERTVW